MFSMYHLQVNKRGIAFLPRTIILLSLSSVFIMNFQKNFATDYYVSPSGNDNNPGTLNQPFKTIGKGTTVLKAADFLYVRTGTYVENIWVGQSGTKEAPITIREYPGELPVIDGQDKLPEQNWGVMVGLEGDYIHFSGFEVKNCNITGKYKGGEGVALSGQYTRASNLKVHHIWETGILASGDFSIVEDCIVWQCAFSNSADPGAMGSGWATGISAARSQADGITTNAILRRNITFNNWGEGLSSFEAEGTRIEDNITYDNWSVNLYISDTPDALIQRNIVYNTPNNLVGQRRPFTLGDERADKPRSVNTIVINNLIYNADFWAFWSTVVPGSGLDNVLIANNTIVNGQFEIGASKEDGVVNKSARIYNNIFSNDNGEPWEIMGPLNNLSFSNNLWSETPPLQLHSDGDVIGNPQLARIGDTSPGGLIPEYFKLLQNSPAINKGMVLSDVTEDFFGNFRDNAPDMGAHEFTTLTGVNPLEGNASTNSIGFFHNEVQRILLTGSQSEITFRLNKAEVYQSVDLYNIPGVCLIKKQITDTDISLDVSSLKPGIYIVVLSRDK